MDTTTPVITATAPGPAAAGADAPLIVTVDPQAVARNHTRLAAMTAAECGAAVKANAYGLGIEAVAPALWRAGCRRFFVALLSEGIALRRLLPNAVIYVLNGVFGDPAEAIAHRLVPFLSSPEALAGWPTHAPFALNVDTGMNRLGLTPAEAMGYDGPAPVLLASHFACADEPDHPQNAAQSAAFAAVRAAFPTVPASLANSAALQTRPGDHYDLARPGIALYGGRSAVTLAPLEPAAKLEARIVQVRTVPAGGSVGYGAAETAATTRKVAIASAGYGDGYLRAGGGPHTPAPAAVNGASVRLIGRVSMDLVALDVTGVACARGDCVELFGPTVPLDAVADAAGTIGYELLTGLSHRADRRIAPL